MPRFAPFAVLLAMLLCVLSGDAWAQSGGWTLIGWNDLGMHCMDDDFSVFSLLPPYNTIHAQLTDPSGQLVTSSVGVAVTYEAVADSSLSINRSSENKTNFWQFAESLFGVSLPVDSGLAGFDMPGRNNTPQAMRFDAAQAWFTAEGIPITPRDDDQVTNTYPVFLLVARSAAGSILATTEVVLPVSTELTCRQCHASGSDDAARPPSGWVNASSPNVDYRLNVLRLHDEKRQDPARYESLLTAAGYDPRGLFATVQQGQGAVLCVACHVSNALPGPGTPEVAPLTEVLHTLHADVTDPTTNLPLGSSTNRSSCYTCHPGSKTRCLRGAMGAAVAADGTLAMQCQDCHGSMHAVGTPGRVGWLDQPSCQNCHTGTALQNSGQIRFASVFDGSGNRRRPANPIFATNSDVPAPGFSLYRFSYGHGGLACEACHGSTHAEYPGSHGNDNLQSVALQGHEGLIGECSTCHPSTPPGASGGPHGMHPVGSSWVVSHHDYAHDDERSACRSCHGLDYRGTELSRTFADRTFNTELGTRSFFKGAQVSCYACHQGPDESRRATNRAPHVDSLTASTAEGTPISFPLAATDADGNAVSFRIVKQPVRGTVGLDQSIATYYPEEGFVGEDRFTYAAWDGSIDSNLGAVDVSVAAGPCDAPFALTSITPPTARAGTFVELGGTGLGPDLQVAFGGVPADLVAGGGRLSARVPALPAGPLVSVTASRGGCQVTGPSFRVSLMNSSCGLLGFEPLLALGLLRLLRRARR